MFAVYGINRKEKCCTFYVLCILSTLNIRKPSISQRFDIPEKTVKKVNMETQSELTKTTFLTPKLSMPSSYLSPPPLTPVCFNRRAALATQWEKGTSSVTDPYSLNPDSLRIRAKIFYNKICNKNYNSKICFGSYLAPPPLSALIDRLHTCNTMRRKAQTEFRIRIHCESGPRLFIFKKW